MKFLKYCLVFFASFLLLNACQNELTFDPVSLAQGSLKKDSTGDCSPSAVAGSYVKDSALNSANYIDVDVLISTAGTYDVRSDTINGYYFHGAGTFNSTGLTTLRLFGFGQPLAAQTDIFQIRFDTSVCEISVLVTSVATQASFTLGSSAGICTGAILAGVYMSGTAMTSSNTATLNVTVTTGGPYSITTLTVNGVYFSAAGTLSTSNTTIVLTAHGTPPASSTNVISDYIVTAGTGSCSFSVDYAAVVTGPASFTFDCASMNGVIYGLTRVGTPVDPLVNADTVTVNVITPGTYSITSVVSLGGPDGIDFSTSGTFTTPGTQTIILAAHGTPTRAGFVFYNISSLQATNPTPCSTAAYYDFLLCTIGTSFNRNFTFSSATSFDNTSLPGFDLIHMKGFASASSSESLELIIGLPTGGSFNNTSSTDVVYTANDLPSKYVKAIYKDAGSPQVSYTAESNAIPQTGPFTINISFCTSGRIEGTFSGVVKDNNGAGPGTKTISGSFGLVR